METTSENSKKAAAADSDAKKKKDMMESQPQRSKAMTFEEYFQELERFVAIHGHAKVPRDKEYARLERWLYKQKRRRDGPYRGGTQLEQHEIDRFDALGLIWLDAAARTDRRAKKKTSKTSLDDHDPIPASTGIALRKKKRKSHELSRTSTQHHPSTNKKTKKAVEEWEDRFLDLEAFTAKHRHCRVPRSGSYLRLHHWLYRQKRMKREGVREERVLDQGRIDRMEALGVEWDRQPSPQAQWTRNYKALLQFKEEHGHFQLPKEWTELRQWIRLQKSSAKNNEDQIEKLNALGIGWEAACDYEAEEENLHSDAESGGGGDDDDVVEKCASSSWGVDYEDDNDDDSDDEVQNSSGQSDDEPVVGSSTPPNRRSSAVRVTPTEEISGSAHFEFNVHFRELERFHELYGNCDVPDTKEWIHLANWLYTIKRCRQGNYRDKAQPTECQIDLLDSLGVRLIEDDEKDEPNGEKESSFSCRIKLIQDVMVFQEIGTITLPYSSTLVDARREIMDKIDFPHWFPAYAIWSFYIPSRGPLSIQEEVSVGCMYMLLKDLGPDAKFCFPCDTEVLIGKSPNS